MVGRKLILHHRTDTEHPKTYRVQPDMEIPEVKENRKICLQASGTEMTHLPQRGSLPNPTEVAAKSYGSTDVI